MTQIEQQTLSELTQDGLVFGKKLQYVYPDFNLTSFVTDVPMKLGKAEITLIELKSDNQTQHINEPFLFSFSIQSTSDNQQIILTYYAIVYERPSGHITRKRYRLSQRKLKPNIALTTTNLIFLYLHSSKYMMVKHVSVGTDLSLR